MWVILFRHINMKKILIPTVRPASWKQAKDLLPMKKSQARLIAPIRTVAQSAHLGSSAAREAYLQLRVFGNLLLTF